MAAPDGAAMFASCWDAEDVTGPHTVGRRFCNLRAFWPQAKTSAQAEFSSAEQKINRVPAKARLSWEGRTVGKALSSTSSRTDLQPCKEDRPQAGPLFFFCCILWIEDRPGPDLSLPGKVDWL